jgi:phage terminase small subunit
MGTGRKPYSTHDVTPFDLPDQRLRPPDSLGPLEKRIFFHLITHVPATQFQPADLPLVCRWCELSAVADRAAAEMATGNLVTEDGRPTPWLAVHEKAVKGLVALSLRLRLSPQSRMNKSPKTQPAGELSYYEEMELTEGGDGDGVDGDRP